MHCYFFPLFPLLVFCMFPVRHLLDLLAYITGLLMGSILKCYLFFDLVPDSPQKDVYNRSMDDGSSTAEGIYTM